MKSHSPLYEHTYKIEILLHSRLRKDTMFWNAWGFVAQNMEIWKIGCLNSFAMLKTTVLQWMDERFKWRLMKQPWRYALILNAPVDGCSIAKRDMTLHGSQWVEVLQQTWIWYLSGKKMWNQSPPSRPKKAIFYLDETALFYNVQTSENSNMRETEVPGRERI
jgi:hypothetical protein